MPVTKKRVETRTDANTVFWYDTPEVQAWLPSYEAQAIAQEKMVSCVNVISTDGLVLTRTAVFNTEALYDVVVAESPVPGYKSDRDVYNLNHGISVQTFTDQV